MIWTWDEHDEFKGQPVMLWRAYAEVLARGIELWLDCNADKGAGGMSSTMSCEWFDQTSGLPILPETFAEIYARDLALAIND